MSDYGSGQVLRIPISNDGKTVRSIGLSMPISITEAEWAQFHKVLRKMKPGLVEPNHEPTVQDHTDGSGA